MKSIQRMMGVAALIMIFTYSTQATPDDSNAVKKAKDAVEGAAPYDWKTMAQSAKVCFRKQENVEQALEWINKSIEINKDPFNLEIKADYYRDKGEKDEALKLYSEALKVGKEQNFWFDGTDIQAKIWKLRE
ncbi:hypothetical protein [Marinoscillum luteum]|uniref:Tetratricopeptide repeat protein n=1 Tax=Marinoscillum luteum TaxID=861051 RepID=A0ABW7N465_9BACT